MREIFLLSFVPFFLLCGCRDPIDERGWRRDDEPKARRICANGVRSEKMRVDIVSIRFRNRRDDRLAVYNEGPSFRTLRALIDFFLFFSSLLLPSVDETDIFTLLVLLLKLY